MAGSMVAASSVYRLATFNLSTDQKIDFAGMPTPANALFVLGLWLHLGHYENWQYIVNMSADQRSVFTLCLLLTLALSVIWLNAPWPVLSFKNNGDKLRRKGQLFVVLLFLVLVIFVGELAFSITVLALLVISQIVHRLSKKKKIQL